MGFAGGVISPLAVSSDLVPASAMGTQRLGQPSAYPLLHPPDQPDLVQTRPTPTLAVRLTFPHSPQRSSAGRQCAQQQPGYPRDRTVTGARHPTSASNEDTPRWPRSNHPVRVVTPATVHPRGVTAARQASLIGPEVGVPVGTRRHCRSRSGRRLRRRRCRDSALHRRGGDSGGGEVVEPAPLPSPPPPGSRCLQVTPANNCHMTTWQSSFSGSAGVLLRRELGHASSQPHRAHPGRKTLLMAVAASIRGKTLGAQADHH